MLSIGGGLWLALAWGVMAWSFVSDAEQGLFAWRHQRYALAIQAFRQSLTLNPHQPLIRYYLADALAKTRRLREAQREYQHILATAPDSQAARFSRQALIALTAAPGQTRAPIGKIASGNARRKRPVAGGPDAIAEVMPAAGADDYLNEITENGRLVRWSVLQQPLWVWVDRNPQGIRNFQPAFVASVSKALTVWTQALDGRLRYELIDTPHEADIRVTWVNSIDTKGQTTESGTAYHAGVTVPEVRERQLRAMEIRMATFDISGRPQDATHIEAVMLHEMGHALGLLGHSDNPQDIMYGQNQLRFSLSRRDDTTIRRLYGEPADITSLPPEDTLNDQQASRIADRLDAQIAKQEAAVALQHDNLSLMNLGNAYFAKGKALVDKAKQEQGVGAPLSPQAAEWFQKAVRVITEGIALDPRAPFGYYNRAVAYQELRQDDQALNDLNQALKLDPRDPKLYREKAWVLAKLQQKTDAHQALAEFLAREPHQAASPEVKRIEQLLARP